MSSDTKTPDADMIEMALEIVRRRAGLVFPSSRLDDAANSIRRASRASGCTDPAAFAAQLESGSAVFDTLMTHLTVGESYFFRDAAQFDFIRRQILPELTARNRLESPLRIWSAGCAAGEEPYSLAILCEQEGLAHRTAILGTDLSPSALDSARKARYRPWSLRESTPEFIATYFQAEGEQMVLTDRIRRRVRFERHNLVDNAGPIAGGGAKLILCRNVLIYFDTDAIRRAAQLLFEALDEDGWLITAPADPLLTTFADFTAIVSPAGLIYRRARPTIEPAERGGSARRTSKPAEPKRDVARRPTRTAFRDRVPKPPSALEALVDPRSVHDIFTAGDFARVVAMTATVPIDGEAWSLRIRAMANIGELDRASDEADAALEHHSIAPELHYLRALISIGQGQDESAIASLRRALYLDRHMAIAHFTLGIALRRKGDTKEAARAFVNAQSICEGQAPDKPIALADGETAGGLADAARNELQRLASKDF